jgi:hypothetical protein
MELLFVLGSSVILASTGTSAVRAYRDADKSLAQPRRKQATATEDLEFHTYILLIFIIGGMLVLFMVTPCINDIKHFNVQLMHTTLKT